ncbi:envelope stress response membrane protein PspC [Alteromonadaceae bacterium M269]|nr:envelope stress response membrane protein PspC [Alteromonadaceae bacterium M269]
MTINRALYRDHEKGKVAGVCAGIAEYFGIETWLVRILTVTGFFLLAGPFVLVAYVAAWFILEKKPGTNYVKTKSHRPAYRANGKGWHNSSARSATASENEDLETKVEVKAKVWQAGEPPKQAFATIKNQFEQLESRLRNMEKYVTSSEFQLNREISRL